MLCDDRTSRKNGFFIILPEPGDFASSFPLNDFSTFQLVFKQAYLFGFQIERHIECLLINHRLFAKNIYLFVELDSVVGSVQFSSLFRRLLPFAGGLLFVNKYVMFHVSIACDKCERARA